MKRSIRTLISATAIGGLATAGLAFADIDDARALEEADISLVAAIMAAEDATQGKAFEAQVEDDSFSPEFEISVLADGKVAEHGAYADLAGRPSIPLPPGQ